MTTKPLPPAIEAAINAFDRAAQKFPFRDKYGPEERTAIIHQYESAKSALVSVIERNLK